MKIIIPLFLALAATLINGECPPPDTIGMLKCSCELSGILTCSDIGSYWHLEFILRSLRDFGFTRVRFKNLTAETLPVDLFGRLECSDFEFVDSVIGRLGDEKQGSFVSKGYRSLVLDNTDVRSGYLDEIGENSQLSSLSLSRYAHPIVAYSLSRMLRDVSLDKLYLQHIELFDWSRYAFSPLTSLETLSLSHLRLTRIARRDLPGSDNRLGSLTLQFCDLSSLPGDLFDGLPNLRELNLKGNKLSSLSPETFKNFYGIINLEENPLACGSGLQWLKDRFTEGTLSAKNLSAIRCSDGSKFIE